MDASELLNLKNEIAAIDSALLTDPGNQELLTLKAELLDLVSLTEGMLQEQQQASPSVPTDAARASPSLSSPITSSPASASHSGYSSPSITTPTTTTTTTATTTSNPSSSAKSGSDPSKQPIYQPPPTSVAPKHWSVGDQCRALYAADGKFYEATILSIGGSGQIFSVQYKGYEASPPAMVGPGDLKLPVDKSKYQKHNKYTGAGVGAGGVTEAGEGDKGTKKRGHDADDVPTEATGGVKKKKAGGAASEQVQKQMAWQNFAKGGGAAKKGKGVSVLKKSIFATPENPEGKVGVVGSGKGMTEFQQRGKHIYGNTGANNQQR
ncbi:hypothetical protein EDD11_003365 [Mortierella claussenii]|nr:hypothetical protein EDD11_003365 [Mortierella claussenii]